jgi:hypothetical protein
MTLEEIISFYQLKESMNIEEMRISQIEDGRDSVRWLLALLSIGGRVTKSSYNISELLNGLAYYLVAVTFLDGTQIGIPAYGDEAVALRDELLKMSEPRVEAPST